MTSIPPLPRKVGQQDGEPAYALLIRALEFHGSRRMNETLDRIAGTKGRSISQFEPSEVARICKADPAAVSHATPVVGTKLATVMGQTLSAEHISFRTRRWCPLCLAERPYHRVWWDILPVTSCPVHGIELATSCGCTTRALQWRYDRTLSCAKGHILSRVACTDADPVTRAFDSFVISRLHDGNDGQPFLDDVPLSNILMICERLGQASLGGDVSIYDVRHQHGVGRLHAEGYRILQGLPNTLDEVLDRLRVTEAARPGNEGLSKSYGRLYQFVRKLPENALGAALRRVLFEHAGRHFTFTVRERSRVDLRSDPGITLTEAAHAVAMPLVRFRNLLDHLQIPYRARERGRGISYRTEMSVSDFDTLRPRLEGYQTLSRTAGELDLPLSDAADLAETGLIDVIAPGRGAAGWVFPANAAAKLLSALGEKAVGLDRNKRGYRPLPRAAKACGASVAEVVALVLAGALALKVTGRQHRDIRSFRVDPRVLADHLSRDGQTDCTLGVAARHLGINQATLGAVLTAGLLVTRRIDGMDRVPMAAIERFRSTWATMPELRKAMGAKSFHPVVAAMSAAAVSPAAAGSRLTDRVFPRAAALRACAEAASRPVTVEERVSDRWSMARDLRMSATMLRQLVEAGLIAMQEGCSFGSITETEIARFKKAYTTTPELAEAFGIRWSKTVVGLLRQAEVRPVCSPPAFHFHLYPRQAAEEVLRSRATTQLSVAVPAPVDDEPTLGIAEVAARLSASPNMINQLIHAGILNPVREIRRGYRTSVRDREVERFRQAYVFANEMGRLAGREHKHGTGPSTTLLLLKHGIQPVCSTPAFFSYLFARDEAVALMGRLGLA